MANINLRDIILYDLWPGVINPNLGIPTGGFDGSVSNDATTEVYPVGTKIQIYNDGTYQPGYSTLTYMKWFGISGKNDIADISSGWAIVGHVDATTPGDSSEPPCLHVTNIAAGSDCTQNPLVAFAVGCMSSVDSTTADTGKFGWFWTGGVCPYVDITFFDGQSAGAGTDITTGGTLAAGDTVYAVVDTSQITLGGGDLSSNAIGLAMIAEA